MSQHWDTATTEPMEEGLMAIARTLGKHTASVPRCIPVRRSFYDAHRRRWLGACLAAALGWGE